MAKQESLLAIREYAASLNPDERKGFIDKFNSIKDDDTKIDTLASRISGLSQQKPMFSSIEEANAAMKEANFQRNRAAIAASGINPYVDAMMKSGQQASSLAVGGGLGYKLGQLAGQGVLKQALAGAAGGSVSGLLSPADTAQEFGSNIAKNTAYGAAISGGLQLAGKGVSAVINRPTIQDKILKTYSEAINPNIARIKNKATLDEFKNKSTDAIKAIANNSDNLKFEKASGLIENRLPKTRSEAFEALNQTKKDIYNKYNSLQKEATDTGANINTYDIAKKSFESIKNNRQFKLYEPKLQKEAESILKRIQKTGEGGSSPAEVQKDIEFLNQKMQGYYKKGEYNAANIYANYASNLREALDSSIEGSLGKSGYQELKNQYSSLKFIEKDLAKAAARQLKQTDPKLTEGITDPLAIMEMAKGLLTSNPSSFASGLTLKSVMNLRKYLDNPDRKVELMFKEIKKLK